MEFPTAPVNESLEEFKKLKAEELNNILRDRGQPVTGKKADLVLRHHVLFSWKAKKLTNVLPEQENVTFLAVTSSKKNADLTYEYCGWGAGIVHGLLTNEDYHPSTLCSCGVWFISCYKEQNTITLQFARQDGVPKLKFGHKYHYQVQGQMYVSNLEWVDFVAWFGRNKLLLFNVLILTKNGGTKQYYPG